MFTALAVVLMAAWLIAFSRGPVSATLTLVIGVVALVLVVVDLLRPYVHR